MSLFSPNSPKMQPRPYQAEALDALHAHVCTREDNPAIVLPTGAGKSPVMAWAVQRWKQAAPHFRAIVLAHVKELVGQNAEKLQAVWPGSRPGIYAAGLRRRDMGRDITFASIDSVYNRAPDFDPFDVIIVDEAHRIPFKGAGKYRRFIKEAKLQNPRLRVIGFTATPYRMTGGPICHRDHILNHVAYEANVGDLINDGYLCPLRSKAGEAAPDLAKVHKRGGEYIARELGQAVRAGDLVGQAVAEAVRMHADRKSVIYFCVDVDHCHQVSKELARHGIKAPAVTGKTPTAERDRVAAAFKRGELRAICNVNVYTEGFDATRTDCVVLLRPTLSKGLYSQMVGRGLRLDPAKEDCLILDFARCIEEHGPIDLPDDSEVKLIACPGCKLHFSKAVGKCPECGYVVPKMEVEPAEPVEDPERRMHGTKAAGLSILSTTGTDTYRVNNCFVHRHKKAGKPDSLRVTYQLGLQTAREWICLDHPGYPGRKAAQWWRARFDEDPPTVDEALADLFLAKKLADITAEIEVKPGRHKEIIRHKLNKNQTTGVVN